MDRKEINNLKSEFHKKYIRTPEFQEVREAVFERDGHRCVLCGRTENLVCHHTSYKHLGQHNQAEIDDCITICQLDHVNHHRGKYNINWYSVDHPRNNDDLREVDYYGLKFLVRTSGEEVYDATTFKKLKLYDDGGRYKIRMNEKNIYLYRLVAKAFPEICGEWFDDCEVHHIDENTYNNRADNLEVITTEEHRKIHSDEFAQNSKEYMSSHPEFYDRFRKPIYQYTLSGNFITMWDSVTTAAEKCNICISSISQALNGKNNTAGDYIWMYATDEGPELFIEPTLSRYERSALSQSVPISQYTKSGQWIKDWDGISMAAEEVTGNKCNAGNIFKCLTGKTKSAYGFVWKYKS